MGNKSVSYFFVGLFVGLIIAISGFSLFVRNHGTAGSDALVLRLGHGLDTSHPVHKGMVYMAERLREKSAGTVEIKIFPGGVLGSEVDNVEQLQRGALGLTKVSAATLENFVPEMALFSLPFIFRDNDHYWNVLGGQVGKEMLGQVESQGLKGLCYYDAGSRSFYTIDRPILHPDDLRGMTIRVMPSRTAISMIEVMGGSPTDTSWGELYTALQQGMVDAAENNPPTFLSSRHYEVCNYYSLNEHASIPDILVVGETDWNRLTPAMQQWLIEAAEESSIYQRKLWQKGTETALEELQEKGVEIFYPDKEPFIESVRPLIEQYEGTTIGNLIGQIQETQ